MSDMLTVYLGRDVIPKFKKVRTGMYRQMINGISVAEIRNAHSCARFWNKMADHPLILQAVQSKK